MLLPTMLWRLQPGRGCEPGNGHETSRFLLHTTILTLQVPS